MEEKREELYSEKTNCYAKVITFLQPACTWNYDIDGNLYSPSAASGNGKQFKK